jgi:cytochrome c biogenesis protein CcdA
VSAAVLVLAAAAGARSTPGGWGPLVVMESVSARLSGVFLSFGTKAPLGYALVAGMVASVNPCGFVLLPAYLGYYLHDDRGARRGRGPTGRALAVSVTVTAAFVGLFGLAGLLAGLAASALTSSLPWIGTAVGVGLILLGGILAAGRHLSVTVAPRAAQHLRAATRTRGLAGYAAYGLAYGLASLGCAWFGDALIKRARTLGRHTGWVSAVLLWLAGGYVVYYWLIAIRLLLGLVRRGGLAGFLDGLRRDLVCLRSPAHGGELVGHERGLIEGNQNTDGGLAAFEFAAQPRLVGLV